MLLNSMHKIKKNKFHNGHYITLRSLSENTFAKWDIIFYIQAVELGLIQVKG